MRNYILDENGEPCPCDDFHQWGRWFENVGNRVVRKTDVGDSRVSTVFLGMDHRMDERGHLPVLWETMIFGGPHDQYQNRYTSRADAEADHERIVQALKEGREP